MLARAALDQVGGIGVGHRDTRITLSNLVTSLLADGREEDAARVARWLHLELAAGEFPRQPPDAWRQAALYLAASREEAGLTPGGRTEVLRAARHLAEGWPPADSPEAAAEGALRVADAITTMTLMRTGPASGVASVVNARARRFIRALGFPGDDPRLARLEAHVVERGLTPDAAPPPDDPIPGESPGAAWSRILAQGPRADWEGAFPEVADWSLATLVEALPEARAAAMELLSRDAGGGGELLGGLAAP